MLLQCRNCGYKHKEYDMKRNKFRIIALAPPAATAPLSSEGPLTSSVESLKFNIIKKFIYWFAAHDLLMICLRRNPFAPAITRNGFYIYSTATLDKCFSLLECSGAQRFVCPGFWALVAKGIRGNSTDQTATDVPLQQPRKMCRDLLIVCGDCATVVSNCSFPENEL